MKRYGEGGLHELNKYELDEQPLGKKYLVQILEIRRLTTFRGIPLTTETIIIGLRQRRSKGRTENG